jgi:hypothetical protein
MASAQIREKTLWRVILVGGHTRSIGKTQLVCDVIRAFPQVEWIAGKVTQYGHGVCAQNGGQCDCAPTEHVCALDWEIRSDTGTDSARFLQAGAKKSFWLRTKQGFLAEGLPLLRAALEEVASGERPATREGGNANADRGHGQFPGRNAALIIESNSLMQFLKPSLYFAVIDPLREDFKESAQMALDRAQALADVGVRFAPEPLVAAPTPESLFAAERKLLEDYRLVPLFYLPEIYGVSSRVRNWNPQPWGDWRLDEVWLEARTP